LDKINLCSLNPKYVIILRKILSQSLYLTSRVLIGLAKRAWEKVHGKPHHHSNVLQHPKTFPLIAATVWGLVMVLFEESPHVLHRSLRQSMDEIYRYQLSSISTDSDNKMEK
jgi:hypothetical protein